MTVVALWLIFYGLAHLTLADSTAITYLRPIFIVIFSVVVLGEITTPRRWIMTGFSLSGMLIIVGPAFHDLSLAYVVAVLGAIAGAAATVITKKLACASTTGTMLAYMSVSLIGSSMIALTEDWPWSEWIAIAGIGIAGALAVWFSVLALKDADASLLGPLECLRLPFALAIGLAWFSELPSIWTLVGSALILASSIALVPLREGAARKRLEIG